LHYRSINLKDLWSGLFFCAVGTLYGVISLIHLPLGQVFNMGPGFFPTMLSGILLVIGSALMVRSFWTGQSAPFGTVSWRAIIFVSLAIAAFALLLAPAGLPIAIFVATLIATFSAPKSNPLHAVLSAAAISAFCVGVFVFAAQMQAPLLGYWFGG
jgi:hypothetical protein